MCFARAKEPGRASAFKKRGQAQSSDAGGSGLEQAAARDPASRPIIKATRLISQLPGRPADGNQRRAQ